MSGLRKTFVLSFMLPLEILAIKNGWHTDMAILISASAIVLCLPALATASKEGGE